ncbi:hypothetical protein DOE63_32510 (plasmid) [Salmonella enterica subsp. diarizonae serovar 59:z10:-]|nr:hypothetical protein DOE63_32510 [Salmonella enterica subsp. diarizonae serovar 59:z10:-]
MNRAEAIPSDQPCSGEGIVSEGDIRKNDEYRMTIYTFFTAPLRSARLTVFLVSPLVLSSLLLTAGAQAAPSAPSAPFAAIERQNQLIQNQQQERLRKTSNAR